MGSMVQMTLFHHYYSQNLWFLGQPTPTTMAHQPDTYRVKNKSLVQDKHKGLFFVRNYIGLDDGVNKKNQGLADLTPSSLAIWVNISELSRLARFFHCLISL